MREILFRGFHPCDGSETIVVEGEKIKGKWIEGDFVQSDGPINKGKRYILPGIADFSYGDNGNRIRIGCFQEVVPSTVGQYINVDCFGTKVFEHDVIAVEDDQGEIYRFCVSFGECGGTKNVKHKVGYMGFHFKPQNEETRVFMEYGARDDILYWLNAYNCEVIGTIFDEEAQHDN